MSKIYSEKIFLVLLVCIWGSFLCGVVKGEKSGVMSLSQLPKELQMEILKNLHEIRERPKMRLVSKEWQGVVDELYTPKEPMSVAIPGILLKKPNFRQKICNLLPKKLKRQIGAFQFYNYKIVLDCSETDIIDKHLKIISKQVVENEDLKERVVGINLRLCPNITEKCVDFLDKQMHMEVLDLSGIGITDQTLKSLSEKFKNLKKLKLMGCTKLTPYGLKVLADFKNLEELDIRGVRTKTKEKYFDQYIAGEPSVLPDIFKQLPEGIKKLEFIRNNRLEIEALKNKKELEEIDLSLGREIDISGSALSYKQLKDILKSRPALRSLSFAFREYITSDQLFDLLEPLENLETLDLTQVTSVTNEFLELVKSECNNHSVFLKNLKKLILIFLPNITKETIDKLNRNGIEVITDSNQICMPKID